MSQIKELLKKVASLEFIGLSFKEQVEEKEIEGVDWLIIGNDYEYELGIKKDTEAVYTVYEDGEMVFVNSSLQQLIDSIKCFLEMFSEGKDISDSKRRKMVKEVKKKLDVIDSESTQTDHWWDYVLEEVEYGILF